MRKAICVLWCLLVVASIGLAAQRGAEGSAAGEALVGTWTGTWESSEGASGGFQLTLEKIKNGPITGKVAVTGEPTYEATVGSLTFDGGKMSGKYDFPPSPEVEVVLAAAFEGNAATGTWTVREKASSAEVAKGTWKVARKP